MYSKCRKKLQAEKLGPYPRSSCVQCGWSILKGSSDFMCTEPGYGQAQEGANEEIQEAKKVLEEANYQVDYKKWLTGYVDGIVKETGLHTNNPEHIPLIQMYALLAMTAPDAVGEQVIHNAWALWTMLTRGDAEHEKMIPFDMLDDRVKALDKIDMWAIQNTAKALTKCE